MKQINTREIADFDAAVAAASGSGGGVWPGDAPLVDYAFDAAGVLLDGATAAYLAYPNALTLRSGKQLVLFRAASIHTVSTSTASVKARSRANDTDPWSAAYTVLDTASVDDHTGGLAQLRDGTVVALICERPSSTESTFYTVCLRSTDDGATFGAPIAVDAGYTGMTFASDVVTLPDGSLLGAFYGTDSGNHYAAVAHSSDGTSWSRRAVVAQASGQDWQEPRLVVMPDGEILCFLRYESGSTYRIYTSRSVDLGKTWTIPAQILSAAGGMPGPHLTRNNVLVLTYRDKTGSDTALWAVSFDRGNTWTLRGSLSGTSDLYLYADWLDLAGGDIACVYSIGDATSSADLYIRKLDRIIESAPVAASAVSYAGGPGMSATNVEDAIDELATEKSDVGHTHSFSGGEVLMQDGVTAPPVPIETEARDDWLYQG